METVSVCVCAHTTGSYSSFQSPTLFKVVSRVIGSISMSRPRCTMRSLVCVSRPKDDDTPCFSVSSTVVVGIDVQDNKRQILCSIGGREKSSSTIEVFHDDDDDDVQETGKSHWTCMTSEYDVFGPERIPALQGHSACVSPSSSMIDSREHDNEGIIWVFGGEDHHSMECEKSNTLYEIHVQVNVISCKKILTTTTDNDDDDDDEKPCARAWHGAVSWSMSTLDLNEHFPKDVGSEEEEPDMPDTSSILWIAGGVDENHEILDDAWIWTAMDSKWKPLESASGQSPFPLAYFSSSILPSSSSSTPDIAVFGGYNGHQMTSDLFLFHTSSFTWSQVDFAGSSSVARCWHRSEMIFLSTTEDKEEEELQCRLVVFGGVQSNGETCDTIQCIDPISGSIEDVLASSEEPTTPTLAATYIGHSLVPSKDHHRVKIVGGQHPGKKLHSGMMIELDFSCPTTKVQDESTSVPESNTSIESNIESNNTSESITYDNGDQYQGQLENEARHGQGTLTYVDGRVYVGAFHQNQRQGQGRMCFCPQTESGGPEPLEFAGSWFADQVAPGPGQIQYSDGSTLEALDGFALDHDSGRNIVIRTDTPVTIHKFQISSSYVGQVEASGRPHGRGTMKNQIEEYSGAWVQGQRKGSGKSIEADGSTYEGMWNNSKKNGFGIRHDGITRQIYEGKWVGNKQCGYGTLVEANQDTYKGEFLHGQKHGRGTSTSNNGQKTQEGAWLHDRYVG